jgi:hypothetical protein
MKPAPRHSVRRPARAPQTQDLRTVPDRRRTARRRASGMTGVESARRSGPATLADGAPQSARQGGAFSRRNRRKDGTFEKARAAIGAPPSRHPGRAAARATIGFANVSPTGPGRRLRSRGETRRVIRGDTARRTERRARAPGGAVGPCGQNRRPPHEVSIRPGARPSDHAAPPSKDGAPRAASGMTGIVATAAPDSRLSIPDRPSPTAPFGNPYRLLPIAYPPLEEPTPSPSRTPRLHAGG